MAYMLASCLRKENLRYLGKEIKRISFKELRNLNLGTNSELHVRREDLAAVKEGLLDTRRYVPSDVTEFFAHHPETNELIIGRIIRTESWEALIEEAARLEVFLTEKCHLFMRSVSAQDRRLGIEQSRRSSQLTLLALIYVPLSFITGRFEMNV
ncbi:hypothetical protein WAI453_010510 [Rhynchosporium graminicola]